MIENARWPETVRVSTRPGYENTGGCAFGLTPATLWNIGRRTTRMGAVVPVAERLVYVAQSLRD